ncbi:MULTISPECIES: DUF447 domain-containing protein [unclassified Methanosarcina]|uniref:DUF447 domain-containing protein n=1 Tax=unclassified Methanosarcina TaxID=2644672 RepID=UPI00061613CC|nr:MULTISPECIES: DUF447 domain-containing protein [unclassified Methanosarcina]AKB17319.1 DUF447 family protein [Methanosarcina sp. WWM596]AKB20716.1 DUF447 family protein [Methanosarcina sp. WH1]
MTGLSSDCREVGKLSPEIDLFSFGIREGISEVIVSTGFESPNAAPIGIITKGGRSFVRLFKGSHTWANVFQEMYLASNVVYDPLLFVRSTFFDLEHSEFEYVTAGRLKFPILTEAAAWVVFECVNVKNTEQALVADLVPVEAGFNEDKRKAFPVPNRGFNAVLEATVHATRYQLSGDKKYLEWIRHYETLASKCGGEGEKKAMKLLYEVLGI